MALYELGNVVPLAVDVADIEGTPANVTTMVLTVYKPDGTTEVVATTNDPVGTYYADYSPTIAGAYKAVFAGTGLNQSSERIDFDVVDPAYSVPYVTVDQLKARLGITGTGAADDDELLAACWSASRAIDSMCDRMFYRVTDTRTFEPESTVSAPLPAFCDLVSVTTLATDSSGDGVFETTWSGSDYRLLPANPNAAPEPRPYTLIRSTGTRVFPMLQFPSRPDAVQITGVFGWPQVPFPIRSAAGIAAAELFRMKDAPLGVAGMGEFGVVRVREIPHVKSLVGPYMRAPVRIA